MHATLDTLEAAEQAAEDARQQVLTSREFNKNSKMHAHQMSTLRTQETEGRRP